MNMKGLARALRTHSVFALAREAAWRATRSIRKWRFQRATLKQACPVQFQPLGYHQFRHQPASPEDRRNIIHCADAILTGSFPLLGYGSPNLGTLPDWHCDWVSGKRWPLAPSHTLTIVRHDGSDVKAPWELSRLQWAPVLANAWRLTQEAKYRQALKTLLADWIDHNPVGQGVHWTVAMEAALRAISLCLTLDLLWPFDPEENLWLEKVTLSLWQHLRFIEAHNEFSFLVRSNHYLSNIIGLTTLSAFLRGPRMQERLKKYARRVTREVVLQTYADGGDQEASTGYHVLVAQMALHSYVVQQRSLGAVSPALQGRLRLMFRWIGELTDASGNLPVLGDCDNGRVEWCPDVLKQLLFPVEQQNALHVRSLGREAARILELPSSLPADDRSGQLPQSGLTVLRSGDASVIFCAMPNGLRGRGSHTHCDKLSIVLRLSDHTVFPDAGSRCYSRSAEQRNQDRSTRAHSTLIVDDAEQNILDPAPQSIFLCGDQAHVSAIAVTADSAQASHRGYQRFGVGHQRTVTLKGHELHLLDEVTGTGAHLLALRFILGPDFHATPQQAAGTLVSCVIAGPRQLTLECTTQIPLFLQVQSVEVSRAYGASLPASAIEIRTTTALPVQLKTRVEWK